MRKMYVPPSPRNVFMGIFLCCFAAVITVSPLPMLYRSMSILLIAYFAASFGGMPFAYLVVVLIPSLGLLKSDNSWLIFLPLIISSGVLAMLGLEYAWRYGALILSPLLYLIPQIFVWQVSEHRLFNLTLPWQPNAGRWMVVHTCITFTGVLIMLFLDRKRQKLVAQLENNKP